MFQQLDLTMSTNPLDEPLRGLATAYDALVNNAEKFLKILLKPIADEYSFLVKNTKEFKERFLNDRKNFDPAIHSVLTADIKQMYSNVNVVRCVSYILEKVYAYPRKYFNFKGINGELLAPPKRENFKQFLVKTLKNFSSVKTPLGVYQQQTGLKMGSALSPLLSNIFIHTLKIKIIEKFKRTGKLISYSRFADDALIVIHKNTMRAFIKEINNYDKSINYTVEEMNQENQIVFLDTTVYINSKNELEFKKYRKNGLQTVISNFEHSVVSKKYLKGGILTNLHRELDSSSSHENFLETLEELREVY